MLLGGHVRSRQLPSEKSLDLALSSLDNILLSFQGGSRRWNRRESRCRRGPDIFVFVCCHALVCDLDHLKRVKRHDTAPSRTFFLVSSSSMSSARRRRSWSILCSISSIASWLIPHSQPISLLFPSLLPLPPALLMFPLPFIVGSVP